MMLRDPYHLTALEMLGAGVVTTLVYRVSWSIALYLLIYVFMDQWGLPYQRVRERPSASLSWENIQMIFFIFERHLSESLFFLVMRNGTNLQTVSPTFFFLGVVGSCTYLFLLFLPVVWSCIMEAFHSFSKVIALSGLSL